MTLAAGTLTVVEECRIVDDVLVLVVSEPRFDAATAPSVRDRLMAELEKNPGRVLLDLSRVTFMDSTGLGVLVQLLKQAMRVGPVAMAGVRGPVASPTFIIARTHPSEVGGPALIHVDAYRLGSLEELDALDLDASLEDSVTLVEWGEGKAEALSQDRLMVSIERERGGELDLEHADEGLRTVTFSGVAPRATPMRSAATSLRLTASPCVSRE